MSIISGLGFFIAGYLSAVGLTQADNADGFGVHGKYKHVKPFVNLAQGLVANFAVALAGIFNDQRAVPIEAMNQFKRQWFEPRSRSAALALRSREAPSGS
ncbi:hypothetical protein [Bordetella avium]|uniref:hypothetical protein n=1 Tax=Bordetella avium TaxID=521 RepID=UPI003BF8CCF3